MSTLGGVPVTVDRHLCKIEFLRWARTHRKSRIAKKWRKRYGAVYSECPGVGYEMGLFKFTRRLVVCPCAHAKIIRARGVSFREDARTKNPLEKP